MGLIWHKAFYAPHSLPSHIALLACIVDIFGYGELTPFTLFRRRFFEEALDFTLLFFSLFRGSEIGSWSTLGIYNDGRGMFHAGTAFEVLFCIHPHLTLGLGLLFSSVLFNFVQFFSFVSCHFGLFRFRIGYQAGLGG